MFDFTIAYEWLELYLSSVVNTAGIVEIVNQ